MLRFFFDVFNGESHAYEDEDEIKGRSPTTLRLA
jgi:hypothetical protein